MRTPRLASISIIGLVLNAILNGIFILQVASLPDPRLLANTLVMWSGFFVAGACIAPFENYFLYRWIGSAEKNSHGKVILFSSALFLAVGVSIYLTQDVSEWTLIWTLILGICTGQIVQVRAIAIAQEKLLRVSISNSIEGAIRVSLLTFFIIQNGEISFSHILTSYVCGNLVALIPYLESGKQLKLQSQVVMPLTKVYGLGVVGLFASLVTGGLPYLASLFHPDIIAEILLLFTLVRSLLVAQSAFVYVKPDLAKKFGELNSFSAVFKIFVSMFLPIYLLIFGMKYSVEIFLGINFEMINQIELIFYTNSLILGAFFTMAIATSNVSNNWYKGLGSSFASLLVSCISLIAISTPEVAFYLAMIASPLAGLLAILQLSTRRAISE